MIPHIVVAENHQAFEEYMHSEKLLKNKTLHIYDIIKGYGRNHAYSINDSGGSFESPEMSNIGELANDLLDVGLSIWGLEKGFQRDIHVVWKAPINLIEQYGDDYGIMSYPDRIELSELLQDHGISINLY